MYSRAGYEFVANGVRSQTLSFSERQMLVFRRVLDIAAKTRPDLVAALGQGGH
jgi:hypothetical protein